MSEKSAVKEVTANKVTPKPPTSENTLSNVSFGEIKKKIYSFRELEIIEVNKETIDRVKSLTDATITNVKKGSLLKEVYLGLFTTFVGMSIGGCTDVIEMFSSGKITVEGFLPIVYIVPAFITLWLFWSKKESENASTDSAVDALKKIQDELSSIYKNSSLPTNELVDVSSSGDIDNNFIAMDKKSADE